MVVIGGGFGGLLAGARLREAGVQDIRVIEKGGDFGGTWYWNRYPGAACDIESYIYLPLLEEVGFMPREKYTRAPEILAHSRAIGEKFGLYDNACFQTEVTNMTWDESSARWIIETNRGDRMKARFVAMANGPLHRPKLPGIPGVDTFKGHTFHTSRWDYAYTGGDSFGASPAWPASASASSAPGRQRCSACPTWAKARASCSSSSAPRPPSTSATTPHRSGVGGQPGARLATAANGQLQHPAVGRLPGRGPGQRRLDRHHPQSRPRRPPARRDVRRSGQSGRADAAGGLQEDGADPRPGGFRGRRRLNGRGAEALLQPVLQASLLPRRLPGHLQPPQRPPDRHQREGRRTHRRDGCLGQRPAL
uniref:NAD(P)/FAD-dependent oxidoreductase n=1 Tax=Phenylobacterium glaciei TaxID=2803784 RepID=A0A974P135_9CAUL|nr:NAD(P)/FAD-dependent oxidoreductase [Phenylobacterium glaciei]